MEILGLNLGLIAEEASGCEARFGRLQVVRIGFVMQEYSIISRMKTRDGARCDAARRPTVMA